MSDGSARKAGAEQAGPVGSDRVLVVLRELAAHPGGVGLEELARAVASPKSTVHRALASLRRTGFAQLEAHGRYVLGDEFLRLAFSNHEARPDHLRVQPILETLAERYGETAHYAVLDDRSIIYRAKVDPSAGAVKLTSTIGGRNPAHSTAVGKLLLSYELTDDDAVAQWVGDTLLTGRTGRTRTTATKLAKDIALARSNGYGVEDEENEQGVACLAVPVFLGSPSRPTGAVSISALTYRTPLSRLVAEVATIKSIVDGESTACA
ncbi:IclR family transcriptional regulator [Amycolatopsis jejuensis]|uniref:IclR family transcriptional regulator n=1 Tax=Amycolatopsis jejuensis TaxID=330084 RepID=UPI000525853F|nr:IclR family transcriptional regulator [Amycolatopsis jejuensis]